MIDEKQVAAQLDKTGGRLPAVVDAFAILFGHTWPHVGRPPQTADPIKTLRSMHHAFQNVHAQHPKVAFWWKDEDSTILGACSNLGVLAGLPVGASMVGLKDVDPVVSWNRQGNLYRRDDRAVLEAFTPKFDIVERQDRKDGTVWLRTNKVPFRNSAGAGTVGAFDAIDEATARRLLTRHSPASPLQN